MKKIILAAAITLSMPATAFAAPEPQSLPCYRPARLHIPSLVCYLRWPPMVCEPGNQCHSWPMPNNRRF
jgi:hypothetical protein